MDNTKSPLLEVLLPFVMSQNGNHLSTALDAWVKSCQLQKQTQVFYWYNIDKQKYSTKIILINKIFIMLLFSWWLLTTIWLVFFRDHVILLLFISLRCCVLGDEQCNICIVGENSQSVILRKMIFTLHICPRNLLLYVQKGSKVFLISVKLTVKLKKKKKHWKMWMKFLTSCKSSGNAESNV